jgi:hypothetical protein
VASGRFDRLSPAGTMAALGTPHSERSLALRAKELRREQDAPAPKVAQIFSEPSAFVVHITASSRPLHRGNRPNVSSTISGR